jgi:hypothetical protein
MSGALNRVLERAVKFFGTTTGRIVFVATVVIASAVAAILGNEDRRHPIVSIANVFSVDLEARVGAQTVTVPRHHSATFRLDDREAPIRIVYRGRDVDVFDPPHALRVLNILGAAPIVRQDVLWAASPTESNRMQGVPSATTEDYCGAHAIDPMDADDILSNGPSVFFVEGRPKNEMRKRVVFSERASPWQCVRELDGKGRQADAEKIRGFAVTLGDVEGALR